MHQRNAGESFRQGRLLSISLLKVFLIMADGLDDNAATVSIGSWTVLNVFLIMSDGLHDNAATVGIGSSTLTNLRLNNNLTGLVAGGHSRSFRHFGPINLKQTRNLTHETNMTINNALYKTL